ncbi:hypothetical protein [Dickeya oryzae]|uniref:hypothetical protein n=1 Tax=Dickeya oryzae TaxID=1240404 RepID=UPI001AECB17A|nr:hypothetical protein [Dickeya oryzae]MBP2848612.1 hypothetical protein [Dickeya oryzae]
MDAAKVRAVPDKNVGNVFEQRLRWPEGRAPWMGRVTTSRAARIAKAKAEGTAPAAQFSHQPEVKERRR